jgi:hypothetical protein
LYSGTEEVFSDEFREGILDFRYRSGQRAIQKVIESDSHHTPMSVVSNWPLLFSIFDSVIPSIGIIGP